MNINDESPVFENLPYKFTIQENNMLGEIVGAVFASDIDDMQPIVYSVFYPSSGI